MYNNYRSRNKRQKITFLLENQWFTVISGAEWELNNYHSNKWAIIFIYNSTLQESTAINTLHPVLKQWGQCAPNCVFFTVLYIHYKQLHPCYHLCEPSLSCYTVLHQLMDICVTDPGSSSPVPFLGFSDHFSACVLRGPYRVSDMSLLWTGLVSVYWTWFYTISCKSIYVFVHI